MRVTTPKILRNLGLLLCFVLSINVPSISSQSLNLPQNSFIVEEGSFADVTICHDPHTADTTFEVSTSTLPNTGNVSPATSGDDFLPISQNVTIPAGTECISQFISIYPDFVTEAPEAFLLRVEKSQQIGFITITDVLNVETADEIKPNVTCITDVTQETSAGSGGAVVQFSEPTAIDNSGSVAVLSASHRPGQYFTTGVTPVTYIFIDPSGNQDSCTFQVTVTEASVNNNPVISSCPLVNDITVVSLGTTQKVLQFTLPTCMDLEDDVRPVTCVPFAGSAVANAVSSITCTCFDTSGKNDSCSVSLSASIGPCPQQQMLSFGGQLVFTPPPCNDISGNFVEDSTCNPSSESFLQSSTAVTCQCRLQPSSQCSFNVIVSQVVIPCDTLPCQNGGTCTPGLRLTYTCTCPDGFEGTDCEIEINPCDSNPCLNGAPCINLGQNIFCQCPTGFTGPLCEMGSEARIDSCPQMLAVPSGSPLEFTPPSCYGNSDTMYPSTCIPASGTFITQEMTTVTCYCSMQTSLQCVFDVTVGQVSMLGNRLKRSSADVSPSPSDMTSEEILTTVITESDDVSTTAMTVTSTTTVAPGTTPSITPTTTELETTSLPVILTTIQELDTTPFIPSTVPVTPDLDTTLLPSTVPTTPVISNCEENPGICGENATCENITDGIQCNCNEGFSPSGPFAPTNSTICVDTDECEDGTHECVNEASCENTIGSYNCTCPRGFYENGLTENGRQDCKACNRSDGVEQKYGFNCSQPCTCVTGAACAKDTGSCSGPICMNLPTCNKNDLNVTVITSPTNGEVPEGTIFVVTCAVNLPSADVNVSWTGPNGEIMDNNAKYFIRRIQMSPPIERLQVNQANATDTGMYNCTAALNVPTDSVQFRTESADITVLDVPEIADLRAFPILNTSITLRWTITDGGGDTLTCRANYTAEETLVTEVQDCSGNEVCWLTDLSSYTLYNITVECRNTAGYSNALSTSERTDTSAPSAPKNPTVIVDNSEKCVVSWEKPELSNGPDLYHEVNQFIKNAANRVSDESPKPVPVTGTEFEQQKAKMKLNSKYTFKICAKNRDHKGECVNASGSCTTNTGAPASIPTIPPPEEETTVNSTSVTLRVPQVDNRNGPISCYEFVVVKISDAETGYASSDEVGFEDIQNKSGENGLPYRSVVMNHAEYISRSTVTIGSEASKKSMCMLVASRRRRRANTVEGGKQLTATNSPLESGTSYDIFMRSYSETSGGMFQYTSSDFVNVTTAVGDQSIGLIVFLVVLVLLIIISVSVALFAVWFRYSRKKKDGNRNTGLDVDYANEGLSFAHGELKDRGLLSDKDVSNPKGNDDSSYEDVANPSPMKNWTIQSGHALKKVPKKVTSSIGNVETSFNEVQSGSKDPDTSNEEVVYEEMPEDSNNYDQAVYVTDEAPLPVKISDLPEYITKKRYQKNGLEREFKFLPQGQHHPCTFATKARNRQMNNIPDVLPYDHSRVKLTKLPGTLSSDYFNASFIMIWWKEITCCSLALT